MEGSCGALGRKKSPHKKVKLIRLENEEGMDPVREFWYNSLSEGESFQKESI